MFDTDSKKVFKFDKGDKTIINKDSNYKFSNCIGIDEKGKLHEIYICN